MAEDVAQRHRRTFEAARAEIADRELAVEVPDAQPVVRDVELGMRVRLATAERVEVRDEVAADAVHVDDLVDVHDLVVQHLRVGDRGVVGLPARRLVRHREALEHRVVEVVAAEQEIVDQAEELAALGAADDPVVVRVRERRGRPDPELRERLRVGALVLRRDSRSRRHRR